MNKIIIENAKSKDVEKYISQRSKPDGHDCWGKTEWTSWDVVIINGEDHTIYDNYYIAHDGKKVIEVGFIKYLPKSMAVHMDSSIKEKEKEKASRYKEYLKLKKEFDIESDENKRIKRDVNIESITS